MQIMQNLNFKTQNQSSKFKSSSPQKIKIDLKQRSYRFALRVINFIDQLPRNMGCEIIGRQLLRCATSIGANIAEARAASSRKDFTNFIVYSLKSANESIFWIELLRDSGKAGGADLESLYLESVEISKILGSSVLTLKGKRQ